MLNIVSLLVVMLLSTALFFPYSYCFYLLEQRVFQKNLYLREIVIRLAYTLLFLDLTLWNYSRYVVLQYLNKWILEGLM